MSNKNTEEFFEKLLGFGPDWGVASIELLDDGSTVELGLVHRREGGVKCPECGKITALHYHSRERRWRHLDMLQYETRIRARIPRCECPDCGVHQIKVPWAEPSARFTLLFEAHAIEVLQAARSTTQACDLLGIGWSTADTIMKRAVQRGLERREIEKLPRVGMDEKSFLARHRYITSLCDIDRKQGVMQHFLTISMPEPPWADPCRALDATSGHATFRDNFQARTSLGRSLSGT